MDRAQIRSLDFTVRLSATKRAAKRIAAYMDRLGLRYGRLDFLVGDELSFLEVNPNGQYAWLDDPAGWPLHSAILDAVLDPASAIRGDECVREAEAVARG